MTRPAPGTLSQARFSMCVFSASTTSVQVWNLFSFSRYCLSVNLGLPARKYAARPTVSASAVMDYYQNGSKLLLGMTRVWVPSEVPEDPIPGITQSACFIYKSLKRRAHLSQEDSKANCAERLSRSQVSKLSESREMMNGSNPQSFPTEIINLRRIGTHAFLLLHRSLRSGCSRQGPSL